MCLGRGQGLASQLAALGATLPPQRSVPPVQSPVLPPSTARTEEAESSSWARPECLQRQVIRASGKSPLFMGPRESGQASRSLGFLFLREASPGPSPPAPPRPGSLLGRAVLTLLLSAPKDARPTWGSGFLPPRGSGKMWYSPGWEGAPDLTAAPLRVLASSVAGWLAQPPWAKPLAVHTCRDRATTPSLFQGTLLPGQPEKALGAWSLPRFLPESPVSGPGGTGVIGGRVKNKGALGPPLTCEAVRRETGDVHRLKARLAFRQNGSP